LLCKVNAGSLSVSRRIQSKVNDHLSGEQPLRQKVATVQLPAIYGDEVDFPLVIRGADVAIWRQPGPGELDRDDASIADEPAPLALDALELPQRPRTRDRRDRAPLPA
jgi:hypothetical protein